MYYDNDIHNSQDDTPTYIIIDVSYNPIKIIDITSSEEDMIQTYVDKTILSDTPDDIQVYVRKDMKKKHR